MYTQAYNDVRNVYNKLLVDSRKEHFRNRIVNSDNKNKGHPNDTNVLIPGNSESIANAYNHYILNTTNHLMSKIPYLVLNANKTNLLLFKTKNHSGQVPSMNINLGNDVEFQLVDNTKFLGVYVDETLRWTSHVEATEKKLNSVCYTLRVLGNYLDFRTLKIIYYSNFESILRYGIIFYGHSNSLQRLFIVQKEH
nr:unnamed protein product [Callosobruchus analis]